MFSLEAWLKCFSIKTASSGPKYVGDNHSKWSKNVHSYHYEESLSSISGFQGPQRNMQDGGQLHNSLATIQIQHWWIAYWLWYPVWIFDLYIFCFSLSWYLILIAATLSSLTYLNTVYSLSSPLWALLPGSPTSLSIPCPFVLLFSLASNHSMNQNTNDIL